MLSEVTSRNKAATALVGLGALLPLDLVVTLELPDDMLHASRVMAVVGSLKTSGHREMLVVDKNYVGRDKLLLFSVNVDGDTRLVRVVHAALGFTSLGPAGANPHHIGTCILHALPVAESQLFFTKTQDLVLRAGDLAEDGMCTCSSRELLVVLRTGASKVSFPSLYLFFKRFWFVRRALSTLRLLLNASVSHLKEDGEG